NRAFFNMVTKFGFTPSEASRSLSLNPAKQLGLAKVTGSLEPGLAADMAVLAPDRLSVIGTFIGGRKVFQS
ncbi:MAG: amidohydrolase family protein, partial [Victivallaceae bacterium]|nr:amidohydrolase family protein [Victivallaceae bacterium]